ncbi:Wzz/FepE/Etk N-terminal domain-containing protein [Gammaproteobacteria bacterium]|nr:Wzz/FepE/Etk N-terminal domain-containing protein [Gammaproteobacteria bacterium]
MTEQSSIIHNNKADEVNLKEVVGLIWKGKLFISIITGIFIVFSILYALNAPNIWTSDSLLTTVETTGVGSKNSSKMASLASMAGIDISGTGSDKSSIAIATIQSRDFFKHLLTKDGILENLMAFESYDIATGQSYFNKKIFDSEKGEWLKTKPTPLEAYQKYQSVLNINYNKLNGLMIMSISHKSPNFAQEFLSLIINEANFLSRERNLLESKKSLEYLNEELQKTKQSEVVLAISSLIESQLKNQMFARAKDNYLLQPIDKPYVPEQISSPNRRQIVIFGALLGLLFSIFSILARHLVIKLFS